LENSDLNDFEGDRFEPIMWKIEKEYDLDKNTEIEKLDGFSHLHSANRIKDDDTVYTGITAAGESRLIRKSKAETKTVKLEKLPTKVFTYKDTVLLLYKTENRGNLYMFDFENEKLLPVAENVFCSIPDVSQRKLAETVFVKGDKVFYKTEQNANEGRWVLIENGTQKELSANGKCVGFNSENTVVFYQERFETFFELVYGKFVQYSWIPGSDSTVAVIE